MAARLDHLQDPSLLPARWGPRSLARWVLSTARATAEPCLGGGAALEAQGSWMWVWGKLPAAPAPPGPSSPGRHTLPVPSRQGLDRSFSAHTPLTASACSVDSDDRSGQYSCIFLPEHAGRTDLEVKGGLLGAPGLRGWGGGGQGSSISGPAAPGSGSSPPSSRQGPPASRR